MDKIQELLPLFYGTHDFNYFSKNGSDPKSTIRTIYKIDLYKYNRYCVLRFQGNSFLRSQIRMMVEFIIKVSQEVYTKEQLLLQLQCKEKFSNQLASANGLYLSKIIY
jgi:tRNA pseudouridine38-40 synthase